MKNHRIIAWAVAGFAAFGVALALAQTPGSSVKCLPRLRFGELGSPIGKLTFVKRFEIPNVPSKVRVYRVQPLTSKRDALVRLLKALPVESSEETDATLRRIGRAPASSFNRENSASACVGGWSVEVWNGGQFTVDNSRVLNDPKGAERSAVAPTPEEARKAADAFLASIDALPRSVHFAKVEPGETDVYGAGDKPGDTVVRSLLVSYSAEMDGIPTYGSVSVYVGTGAAVVSVVSYLRQVVPGEEFPILSPQEAFDKLCTGECHTFDAPSWDATVNVKSLRLVYFEGALSRDHTYIMPVYYLEGDAVSNGKESEPWKAFVEAVRPEYLETARKGG